MNKSIIIILLAIYCFTLSFAEKITNQQGGGGYSDLLLLLHLNESTGVSTYDNSTYNSLAVVSGGEWQPSLWGNGLLLDGVNDYIQVPDNARFDITDKITISAWIKTPNNGEGGIVSKTSASASYGVWTLHKAGALFYFQINQASQRWGIANVWNDVWINIIVEYDSSWAKARFYVNGERQTLTYQPADGPTAISTDNNPIWVGPWYSSSDPSRFFDGEIEEVIIYHGIWSEAEITHRYSSQSGVYQ